MTAIRTLIEGFPAQTAHDVAVDLGTAHVRIFVHGRGLVADEPSVVRVRRESFALVGAGARAGALDPEGGASFPVRPLCDGVVRDLECAGWLMSAMLRRARGLSLVRPVVLACAPSDASPEEVEALREAVRRGGAGRVTVVPEPLAAAVGVGLDLRSSRAQMLVDVGEGVTDVAVFRNGLVLDTLAVRVGCGSLRSAVANGVARIAGAAPTEAVSEALVRRALADSGEPLTGAFEAGLEAIRAALEPVVEDIVDAVCTVWTRLPADAASDIVESGAWLTGGGARLPELVERVARGTSVTVRVPPNPLHAVIRGASRMAEATGADERLQARA